MDKKQILETIIKNIYEVLPELEGQKINPTDELVHLGANSIDRSEILMMTMEDLELNIDRVELFGTKNIGELSEVIYEKMHK